MSPSKQDPHDWKRVGYLTYWCRRCGAIQEGHNGDPKIPRRIAERFTLLACEERFRGQD